MARHIWSDHQLPQPWKRFLVIVESVGAAILTAYTTLMSLPEPPAGADSLRHRLIHLANAAPFGAMLGIGTAMLIALVIVRIADHRWDPQRPYVGAVLRSLEQDLWSKPVSELSGGRHRHRITLFQAERRNRVQKFISRNKSSHLLVPRARLPQYDGRDPQHTWLADEHDPSRCTGVAGLVFTENGSIATSALPDIQGLEPDDPVLAEYAALTNDTIKSVCAGGLFSRVIGGFPICLPNGRRWGVLIVDSTDPTAVEPQVWQREPLQQRIKVLSSLLAEVQ
jgi:hypothetical protein